MSNQEFQRTFAAGLSSPRPPSTSISWNEGTCTTNVSIPPKSSSAGLSLDDRESGSSSPQAGPPFARRVVASTHEAYRSLTPINMDLSGASSAASGPKHHKAAPDTSPEMVKISFNSEGGSDLKPTNDSTIVDSDLPSLPADGVVSLPVDPELQQPLSLSDIQLIDGEDE